MQKETTWSGTWTQREIAEETEELITEPPESLIDAFRMLCLASVLFCFTFLLLVFAFTPEKGSELLQKLSRGLASSFWYPIQWVLKPMGLASTRSHQYWEERAHIVPVEIELRDDTATPHLSWICKPEDAWLTERRRLTAPPKEEPAPRPLLRDGTIPLSARKVALDLTRDPDDVRILYLDVRSPRDDAHIAIQLNAADLFDDEELERCPPLERSAVALDTDDQRAFLDRFVFICGALDLHTPRLLRRKKKTRENQISRVVAESRR